MKTIKTSLAGLFVGMTALWLLAEAPALQAAHGFFPWRRLLVQYTGLLAMGAMSAAMLLAVRPAWLESRLHGLDKMYRLHKWLGMGGLVLAIAHWLCAQGPKWLVQAGLLTRPARGQRAPEALEILRQLRSLRGLAEDLGEKAFYIAVVLIVLALVKRFPYRHFFRTHRWLALVYLVLVFHTVVLMEFPYWGQGVGWAMGLLLAAGSVAAAISLLRRIGVRRKAVGEIARVDYMDGVQVHAVALQLKTPWPGHDAGQFAFVTFDEKEGAHPFTISSAWGGDGRLLFLIKALGDYTRTLGHALRVGDAVTVEGPYGRFQFNGQAQRQVWIGAGIGVTPFVARMQALLSYERSFWIAGGRAKAGGIDDLHDLYPRVVEAFLIGEAAGPFAAALGETPHRLSGDMQTAVKAAYEAAAVTGRDEVVLLSPAAASFDQYPDFEARGEAFRAAVLALGATPASAS